MTDRVTIDVDGGVADVRLARPDKLNALDLAMFEGLLDTGKRIMADPRIRAVVLSGEGRAFCAGLDFSIFSAFAATGAERLGKLLGKRDPDSPANLAQRICYVWQEVAVPVIAAVHGVAYGGGLQIALGADMRYARPDARLSVREIEWGIIPDMSGTQTLRHLVGLDVAKELTFTGRVVAGSEALALGLVTRMCEDPRAVALTTAREIASKSPDAIRAAKQLLNTAVSCTLAEGLQLEERLQVSLLGTPNQVEAVAAGLAKRAPRFQDPS